MKVVISNRQVLYSAPKEWRDAIKEQLTYKNAMRYGKYAYTKIPKYLTYYNEFSVSNNDGSRSKALSIPIGVDLRYPKNTEIIDLRKGEKVKYPPFLLELRKDQKCAEEAYISSYEENASDTVCPKSIIQLPTGKGKSILALHIAQRLKVKTL